MPDSQAPTHRSSALRKSDSVQPTVCLKGIPPKIPDHDTQTQPDAIELTNAEPIPAGDDRYRIVREIGRGGMGVVFRGYDVQLERELAVKVLRETHVADACQVRRFQKEAWVVGQLQHPGVVPLYDSGQFADDRPYFVMKLIEGQTLAVLLNRRADADADRAELLKVFDQICQTIAYAHSRGVVHRDLKPSNIMVGEFGEVQVMDWGLARILPDSMIARPDDEPSTCTPCHREPADAHATTTLDGEVIGTPAYMSPEQACGDSSLDERADVFGLGAILCEILTGHPPYLASVATEALHQALHADQSEMRGRLERCSADPDLIALAGDCLQPSPSARPADAGEVVRRLRDHFICAEKRRHDAELERAAALARLNGEQKRRRLEIALGAALVTIIGIAAGSAILVGQQRARRAEEQTLFQNEKADRKAEANRRILHSLDEADELRIAARTSRDSLPIWSRALAAARRAEAVPTDDLDEPKLTRRIQRTIAELAGAEKSAREEAADRRIIAQIEEARLAKSGVKNGHFDMGAADPVYTAAFHDYGIDVPNLGDDEAVRHIADKRIKIALSTALVDWAISRRVTRGGDDPLSLRLIGIAKKVDTDPWRQTFTQPLLKFDSPGIVKLAKSEQADKQFPATIFLVTSELASNNESGLAIDLLRRTLPRHASDFWLNYRLAFLLLESSPPQFEEATNYFIAAVAIRPQSPGARVNLSYALMHLGRYQEGIPHGLEAVRLAPTYSDAYNNLGACQLRIHALDDAIKNLRLAIKYKPDNAVAYQNLAEAFNEKGDANAGFDAAKESIRLDPSNAYAHFDMSVSLSKLNRHKEAEAAARQAVKLGPTIFLAHFQLGNALGAQNRDEEAVAAFREAIRLNPDHPETICNLAQAYEQLGRFAEAFEAMKRGHELGRRIPNWPYPSEQWLKDATELVALDQRLTFLASAKSQPATANEALVLSQFALQWKHQPLVAVEMFEQASRREPALANGKWNQHRSRAIRAAAQVQRGNDETARNRCRQSALTWMRADLAGWEKTTDGNELKAIRAEIDRRLADADLQLLREPTQLAKLQETERNDWTQVWADLAKLKSKLETR